MEESFSAMLIPKMKIVDDPDYREYLRGRRCRRCGHSPCDAAHLGHSSIAKKTQGDDICISLCRPCHNEMDTAREGKEKWLVNQVIIPEQRRKYRMWKDGV